MRTSRLIISSSLLVCACAESPSTSLASSSLSLEVHREGEQGALLDACWAVGVLDFDEVECPEMFDPQWVRHGSQMFVDGSAGLSFLGLEPYEVPWAMRRFCLYQWTGAGAPMLGEDLPDALAETSMDCPRGAPLASPVSAELADFETAAFRARVQAPEGPLQGGASVMVGLVDARSTLSSGVQLEHPDSLQALMSSITCTAAGCPLQIVPTLGLPLDEGGAFLDPDGGSYGTRAHLAMGIMEAVWRWRQKVLDGQTDLRLVLNLSLGWVTEGSGKGCGTSDAEPWCSGAPGHISAFNEFLFHPKLEFPTRAAVEAVHAALLYATCNGALVVASAGNAAADSCNIDPVAPAAWARYPAPTEEECEELGFLDTELELENVFGGERPLVHPVSGIEPDDSPIAQTRPESETRLAAPGSFATFDGHTALSGTSVSAAVVSTTFALLWSRDPQLSPAEVFDFVRDSARPISRTSQHQEFLSPPGTPMGAVTVCGALAQHAVAAGMEVPYPCLDALEIEATAEDLSEAAHALLIETDADEFTVDAELFTDSCELCGDPIDVWLPDLDIDAPYYLFNSCNESPASFTPDTGPSIVGPQPDVPVCPDCPLTTEPSEYVVLISIDDAYRDADVVFESAFLRLTFPSSRATYDLSAVVGELERLQTADSIRVRLPGDGTRPRAAVLQAYLSEPSSGETYFRSSELLLAPVKVTTP